MWCTVLYEVFVLASISCKEGVSSIQYFIAIQCYMKSLSVASISCKEGVACGVQFCMKSLFWRQSLYSIQYFIAIQCYMKSLFSRQSVVGRVCLAFNILSQYCAI